MNNPGNVSTAIAKAFAEKEFEKYRIKQDHLYESDFDRHIKKLSIDKIKDPTENK